MTGTDKLTDRQMRSNANRHWYNYHEELLRLTNQRHMGLQLLGPTGIQTTGKFADFGKNYQNRTAVLPAVVVPHATPK